ncbi:MAG TPA: hypothetical protein GXX51_06265 [Firmicutes bacterium]|nr:hypothetical protein [Bacillota bacterium]
MRLFCNYLGRRVLAGEIVDGIFRKYVKSWQKLYVLDAYGLDKSYIDELEKHGCHTIELHEIDTGDVYTIDLQKFYDLAIPKALGKFGIRYYLPLRYWNKLPGTSLARGDATYAV